MTTDDGGPLPHSSSITAQVTTTAKTQEQLNRKARWHTKREKERNRARFLIRARVAREAGRDCRSGQADQSDIDESKKIDAVQHHGSSSGPSSVEEDANALRSKYLRAIEAGSVSTFSLRNLESHRDIISHPVSVSLLTPIRLKELAMSRFGEEYRDLIMRYLSPRDEGGVGHITMMEYAAMIGEYDILKAIIVGGYNLVASRGNINNKEREERVVQMVCKRLHLEKIPLTLTAYLVKSFAEMRMRGWCRDDVSSYKNTCNICKKETERLLCFGKGCKHSYCELCMWQDLVENLDERHSGDVVICPTCGASFSGNCGLCADSSALLSKVSRADRCKASLHRYDELPQDTNELRVLAKEGKISRRKCKRNTIHSTWHDAILPTLGSSKEVRRDRYFRFAESGDVHCVRYCLEVGVDVNMVNEYNQTTLYIACWRGHKEVVRLLLDWGADSSIEANGQMTCYNVALANGIDIAKEMECSSDISLVSDRLLLDSIIDPSPAEFLIDLQSDHEGAGSFYVDNTFSDVFLSRLDELFNSLPVDLSDKAIKQKKTKPCSERSYFCDAEGSLCAALADVVAVSMRNPSVTDIIKDVYFFPHMRFLNYDEPSGWLAPHTDLVRADPISGRRSTHTFILYLTDCTAGGETALLSDAASCEVMAKVAPRRGRLFLFPHECPHEGMEVISTPKILLRGEAYVGF